MKNTAFLGFQIITIVIIFTLAILKRSLISIGYIILCIPLFMNLNDFFFQKKVTNKSKKSKWTNPYIISYPLMLYSFIDLAL